MLVLLACILGPAQAAEPPAHGGFDPAVVEGVEIVPPAPSGRLDPDRLAAALAAWIRVPTTNPPGPGDFRHLPDGTPEWVAFLAANWLDPLGLSWRVHEGGALLVEVDGPDARPPVALLSHADVVPVDPASRDRWSHPPTAGVVAAGEVHGRGALDDKLATVTQLEALRVLLESGDPLSRDLVFIVGCDEETAGSAAAAVARQALGELGPPAALIDEGSFILPDFLPGLTVAAVAVAEKTYLTIDLVVRGEAGHSSMPRPGAPTHVLAAALSRVAAWETPRTLHPVMDEALRRLGAASSFPESLLLGHPRLFRPVLLRVFGATAAGNAVTRDTVAITILEAGVKDNVVPGEARATLNVRLLPGHGVEAFLSELAEVIDDERVEIVPRPWAGGGGVGDHRGEVFTALEAAIADTTPQAVVIPTITPATTDARWFAAEGLDTYRIVPVVIPAALRETVHGIDERVPVAELERAARTWLALYRRL